MAKDDYDVIAYRVLVYFYACMKRKILFEEPAFQSSVMKNVESDEYFANVLRMMQEEGLIRGVVVKRVWGGTYILVSDPCDIEITVTGIRYLKENSTMKKVGDALKDAVDIIASLAELLAL